MKQIVLDGSSLTAADVVAAARGRVPVRLADTARERIARDRLVVDEAVSSGRPVYGLTTGLGAQVTYGLPAAELAEFSIRTVRGRAAALGDRLPAETVRAAMAARCNEMAHGGSGVQPAVAEQLAAMLNRGVHPVVPEFGSTGISDLCQLAHVGLVVFGEGTAEVGGEVMAGAEALARAGLRPVPPGPKDGLALCSSNALGAGLAALVHEDADAVLAGADSCAALSFEAFRASLTPLDPRVQAARPAPGQQRSADRLRELLAGGELLDPGAARRLQDPVSIRCASQVHGACRCALGFLAAQLEPELNGAGDNPLVLGADQEVLSSGNFHTAGLAVALDAVALAICQVATASAHRAQRLLSHRLTGLPERLAAGGPGHSGFGPLMKSVQALLARLRQLAAPCSILVGSNLGDVDDDATHTVLAARRDQSMLTVLGRVLAVEAVVAAQALEFARPQRRGHGAEALYRAVRARVRSLDSDRPCSGDVETIANEIFTPGRREPRDEPR